MWGRARGQCLPCHSSACLARHGALISSTRPGCHHRRTAKAESFAVLVPCFVSIGAGLALGSMKRAQLFLVAQWGCACLAASLYASLAPLASREAWWPPCCHRRAAPAQQGFTVMKSARGRNATRGCSFASKRRCCCLPHTCLSEEREPLLVSFP
jgi:hypothetical protein